MTLFNLARFCLSATLVICATHPAFAQQRDKAAREGPLPTYSQLLGRPTDTSIAVNILSNKDMEVLVEFGTEPGRLTGKSGWKVAKAGEPLEIELDGLKPNTAYTYVASTRQKGDATAKRGEPHTFHTQRSAGVGFRFALQGDSHPERLGKMYEPDLYFQTMRNVAKDDPDFYILMGDDFSIERLIERDTLSQKAVDAVYAYQRGFLGIVGQTCPLFLVNGNHEQAARYLLDGEPGNAAIFAAKARNRFYSLPAPDSFYTGDKERVKHIGLLRDYYAWTWGDALFVVIDPYWHSEIAVDNEAGTRAPRQAERGGEAKKGDDSERGRNRGGRREGRGGGKGGRDMWQITIGDEQYRWLSQTLRESKARFKFVFAHHVLGTGRGGVEQASKFEWGGLDQRGVDRFREKRPKWDQPIHDLMRDAGVTIFFQGHDHLYARQELDGVIYQAVPNPADPTFTAFNENAYKSGDIFPNSGHLRVTVESDEAKVEYVRSFRQQDETGDQKNGTIAHSYTVKPRKPVPPRLRKVQETRR